jgi:hypothetical protein
MPSHLCRTVVLVSALVVTFGVVGERVTADTFEFVTFTAPQLGHLETTSSSAHDGKFELRCAELVLTPDNRARPTVKRRVRIYDEYVLGRWTRAMSLLDDAGNPPAEVQYMRIEDAR